MKVGDLVTVIPGGVHTYLVTGEQCEEYDRALGRLFELFSIEESEHVLMHEKWIKVVE